MLKHKLKVISYQNAEVMNSLAWKKLLRVVVFVRRQDFTRKFSVLVWKSSEVEREASQVA